MSDQDRLVEAANAFLQISSDEEMKVVLQRYPELSSDRINFVFENAIEIAKENGELEVAEFFEQYYQMLQDIRNSFGMLIQRAKLAEQRYSDNADVAGLSDALDLWDRVLQHPSFSQQEIELQLGILNDRAGTYLERYWAQDKVEDLQEAIRVFRQLIDVAKQNSPNFIDLPIYFNNLGNCLREFYKCSTNFNDLKLAIQAFEEAVNLTKQNLPDSPDLLIYLNNLASGLSNRYEHMGNISDLLESINIFQQTVNLTKQNLPNSPDLPSRLNNLGNMLKSHYAYTGNVDDLQAAIKSYQQAIDFTEKNLPSSPNLPIYFNNLGNSLRNRYLRLGNIDDLQAAIKNYQQAIDFTKINLPNSIILPLYFSNLAGGLSNRCERLGDVNDLYAAIKNWEKSVELTDRNSPDLPDRLNGFGAGLRERYKLLNNVEDLHKAIALFQQSVDFTKEKFPDSPDLSLRLSNLGSGLKERYKLLGNLEDLQVGIGVYQQAVDITQRNMPDSPNLTSYFNNLGNGIKNRYVHSGNIKDLEKGKEAFKQALQLAKNAPIVDLLISARNWLNWAFERNSWEEMEESYPSMQNASRSLVGKQLSREHQEAFLEETQGIAAKVAYSHIQRNDLKQAVEALEQGAARLLSAALLARSKVDLQQLEQQYSDLYQDYQQQFKSLQNVQYVYQHAPLERQSEALQKFQSENERFNEILNRIRQQKGFEHFLSIATDSNVVFQAAQTHPLIYIFSTDKGGYALIVFRNDIKVISLPELKNDVLTKGLQAYFKVYNLHSKNFKAWQDKIEETTSWLWEIIWQPLIEFLPKEQKNITLIPNGLLNLLPLHLAWTQKGDKKHYILDDFVINYAPNALSLETAKKRPSLKPDKLLIIDDPFNKLKRLDYANIEATTIAKHFNQNKVFSQHEAVLENVKNELEKDYNVLHFSCHGLSNLRNPLETGLCMVDYSNDDKDCSHKLTVQDFLNAKLNARLVTLSACETGMIGTKLPEEVVNLPASLLQAGVAGVVASLWAVSDFSTALLMIKFYENFAQQSDNIALSLQQAQHWLRDSTNKDFLKYIEKHQLSLDATQKRPFRKNNPQDKPFQHCYYWGAFYVTGI